MRVLISDYKEQMEADYSLTIHKLKELLPDCEVVVEPYGTKTFFSEKEGIVFRKKKNIGLL